MSERLLLEPTTYIQLVVHFCLRYVQAWICMGASNMQVFFYLSFFLFDLLCALELIMYRGASNNAALNNANLEQHGFQFVPELFEQRGF